MYLRYHFIALLACLDLDPFGTCQIHPSRDEKTEADKRRNSGKHSGKFEVTVSVTENRTTNWRSGQSCPAAQEEDGALPNSNFSDG